MFRHVPSWLGGLLRNVRAGHAKLLIAQDGIVTEPASLSLRSPAFANGERLPERFTGDGAGVSPPLFWSNVPEGAACLALLVEDPDAPAPQPLVHALVWAIPASEGQLQEGAIRPDDGDTAGGADVGRHSFFGEGWLPPDPPNGHGNHDYVFQLFALSETPDIGRNPGRSDLARALKGRVLAAGMLVGTYSRGEARPLPVGTAAMPAR
jgi:Raf kinase inhibitor-like YbhB/YbcL family protein